MKFHKTLDGDRRFCNSGNNKGLIAYEMVCNGYKWRDIEDVLRTKHAICLAKSYAHMMGFPWPGDD